MISFELTFDYLCPFARNINDSVLEGVAAGESWEVRLRPFSLAQTKVDEGGVNVWDRPPGSDERYGVLALEWGLAVRDSWPERFPAFHIALFGARHDRGADIGDPATLADVATSIGVDAPAAADEVASGTPARTLGREHEELVSRWSVFGVPTLIVGEEAVFVRSMERHRPDEIARLLELIEWTNLNEFKRTRIPR